MRAVRRQHGPDRLVRPRAFVGLALERGLQARDAALKGDNDRLHRLLLDMEQASVQVAQQLDRLEREIGSSH